MQPAAAWSLADIVAVVVGVSNLVSLIIGGVVVWWRVALSDRMILADLADVKERLRVIETQLFGGDANSPRRRRG